MISRILATNLLPAFVLIAQPKELVCDFSKHFEGFSGAFVMYDKTKDQFIRHNPTQCAERFSPASTFKIVNSLIGLETGVIAGKDFVIPWDSVQRPIAEWNRDNTLETAVRFSVVPYFQELARRVGNERMKKWIDTVGYGNRDISGGIGRFWLGSTLTISANEQIDILRRLHSGTLPFSAINLDIVRQILVLENKTDYVLRGKTGFARDPQGRAVSWFVGYLERGGDVYFFATNIVSPNIDRDGDKIFNMRKPVTLAILRELGLL